MVTLNLHDDCASRAATSFRRGMTDRRFLELEITEWLSSAERRRQLDGEIYYDGRQAVLGRKRMILDDNGNLTELRRVKAEKEEEAADPYRAAFESGRNTGKDKQTVKDGDGDDGGDKQS